MGMTWTEEQKKVITTRGRNILVSAAAGSGKTAVLVARILSRITDAEDPVDLDRLLIVTFTKAAAGEMRERIVRAIAEARREQPDNEHLMRQTALIPGAMITTIDGFCSYVIRNYGHLAGITPGARVAESGETELMKQDALRDVLEAAYADETPGWKEQMTVFVETFATGKSERGMEEIIRRTADEADSSPDPEGWLAHCLEEAEIRDEEDLMKTAWMQSLMREAAEEASQGLRYARENLDMALSPDGPSAYLPAAESDAAFFEDFMLRACRAVPDERQESGEGFSAGDYEACRAMLINFNPARLSSKKALEGENPSLREIFKQYRSGLSEIRKSLLEDFFSLPVKDAALYLEKTRGVIGTLIELVRRYRIRYAEIKQTKRVMDFPDLEHGALRILRGKDGRTYAAKELSARFREVMIDEYQDSNYLQEAILTAVSRNEEGEQNYFSVGDVKQSIYSFRQARPELFMEKFDRYAADETEGVRIDLHKNFRSRGDVIRTVNGIFRQIMRREAGGVRYDDDAALIEGASYPPAEGMKSELLAVIAGEEAEDGQKMAGRISAAGLREMEARAIGGRIRELVEGGMITDQESGEKRRVRYGDIVILIRTMEGWADVFADVLESMRIPAVSTAKSGYFSAIEVTTVLNYLSVLDNPEQDIPFAAVLTSAFAGLTAEELTEVRTADLAESLSGSRSREDVSLYSAARAYADETNAAGDPVLKGKLQAFFGLYDSFAGILPDTPLHELIYGILTKSGFLEYASALPGGAKRALNLRMLADKAMEYEKTSYIGLFNFIRYIENLRKYNQDFGELSALSGQEDIVRIISIHKSKGLEYPIVFAAGMSKTFNMQDLNGEVLIHPELGAACDYVDLTRRVKVPTLLKEAVRRRKAADLVGEELRVLYVALTRAKQKLIMTGTFASEKKAEDLFLMIPAGDEALPAGYIRSGRTYMDWVFPAVRRMNERAERIGLPEEVCIRFVKPSDLASDEVLTSIRREDVLTELKSLKSGGTYDEAMRRVIRERFSWQYPHEGVQIPVEVSVSEIKEDALRGASGPLAEAEESAGEEAAFPLFEETEEEHLVPAFYRDMQKEGSGSEPEASAPPASGARRGTAYHRAMELLDMKSLSGLQGKELYEAIREGLEEMVRSGRMTGEEAGMIRIRDLQIFAESSLGQRMIDADRRGALHREQPFVLGMKASDIRREWPEDETVFVQGIMDAFFYEGGADKENGAEDRTVIIVDYKTDRVKEPDELLSRYRVQLDAYADALGRVTGCRIGSKEIWSFTLQKEIIC